MRRLQAFLIPFLALTGCVSASHIPPQITQDIPKDAKLIRLYCAESPDACFGNVYRTLAAAGFSIAQENQQMGTLSTDFKDIGQGTTLKVTAFLEEHDSGTIATLRGQWGITSSTAAGLSAGMGVNVGGSTAEDAVWGGSGRPKVAFGELAVLANKIEHNRLEYAKE